MIYTSLQNPKIKELLKLKQKKYRDQKNQYIIEGKHLVEEAIKKNAIKEIFALEKAKTNFENISYISEKIMKQITDLESMPSMIALCKKKEKKQIGNRIVVLEDVQDPGNIGTIIRSAVAFHVDTLILTKGCADIYSSKVLRATQGMIFHLNIFYTENIKEEIQKIKQKKIPIFGTKVDGGKEVSSLYKKENFAIIMGSEGKGLQKETVSLCDDYLYIQMNPLCESLNVGVATSILLYELDKKG